MGGKSGGRTVGGSRGNSGPSSQGIGPKDLERAFNASPGARDNFVRLDHFREKLGGTRAEQDAAIREGRVKGVWTLDTHEGLANPKGWEQEKPKINAAAIYQGETKFVYISRRDGG